MSCLIKPRKLKPSGLIIVGGGEHSHNIALAEDIAARTTGRVALLPYTRCPVALPELRMPNGVLAVPQATLWNSELRKQLERKGGVSVYVPEPFGLYTIDPSAEPAHKDPADADWASRTHCDIVANGPYWPKTPTGEEDLAMVLNRLQALGLVAINKDAQAAV